MRPAAFIRKTSHYGSGNNQRNNLHTHNIPKHQRVKTCDLHHVLHQIKLNHAENVVLTCLNKTYNQSALVTCNLKPSSQHLACCQLCFQRLHRSVLLSRSKRKAITNDVTPAMPTAKYNVWIAIVGREQYGAA